MTTPLLGSRARISFTPTAVAHVAGATMGVATEMKIGVGNGLFRFLETALLINVNALTGAEASYVLKLYSITPPSAYADATLWDLPAGDQPYYMGELPLGVPVDQGASLFVQTLDQNKQVWIPTTGSIFAYLVTGAAFTPTAVARQVTAYGMAI